jgi:hypothetical protein
VIAITDTRFGTITIDGETYEHDVVVRLSCEVVKRKKKLSKKIYSTSHTISEDEIRFVYEKGCKRLVVGTEQSGLAVLSTDAAVYLEAKGCEVTAHSPHRKPSRHSVPPRRAPVSCFT